MTDRNIAKTTDPPADCLTPGDRALLNAVFGWHMPGAAFTPPAVQTGGRPILIPLMAWLIADARRHGDVQGEITPDEFAAAAALVNTSPTQALRLTPQQIARGLRHLESISPGRSVTILPRALSGYGISPGPAR